VTLLFQIAAFALGAYLSIRMIASLYAIIDLWYAMEREYARVLAGILRWAAAILAPLWLFAPPYRSALGWGLSSFAVFYSSLFVIRYPVLRALRRSGEKSG
jgi:hypothetical protein